MNQHLQTIFSLIQQSQHLSDEEKAALNKVAKDADKAFSITEFKLDRTEKVKRTTAILLEETIAELEQKRKAVEAQNRELEVEAALERVRAIAMSMMKPDDLIEVAKIQFNELKQLGFTEIRNALIGIFNDDKNYFIDYDFSDFSGGSITNIPYNKNPVIDRSLQQMKSATDAFTEFIVEGKELEEWKAFRQQNGEYEDIRLKDINALYYYFYSISQGNIGISSFKKISAAQLNILKRFRNVFDLAYKRYTDITTAELQAREAQVQLALERVRARTMAMQHSNELPESALLLFQQVQTLGMPAWSAGYCIWDEDKQGVTLCMSSEGVLQRPFHVPLTHDPSFMHMYEAYERGESFYAEAVGGEELVKHYQYMRTLPVVGEVLDGIINEGHQLPVFQIFHLVYFSQGFLLFITYEPVPHAHDIFKRFGNVFDQTYTRFLDLQRAEAQAREAQIEAALERVRARTMAMQRSDELQDAAIVLFQQVQYLGVETGGCGFNIWDRDENSATVWMSSAEGGLQAPFKLVHTESEIYKEVYEVARSRKDLLVKEVGGKDLKKHFDYLSTLPGIGIVITKLRETGYAFPDKVIYHFAFFNQGYLSFHLHEPKPETHDIFKRFAKVFEQTYTRYLDLQKAEAQARESQIETALERVRAKTMAMQKPSEFVDVINVIGNQFVQLGFDIEWVNFGANGLNISEGIDIWNFAVMPDNQYVSGRLFIPFLNHPAFIIAEAKLSAYQKSGDDFFEIALNKNEKDSWLDHIYLKTIFKDTPEDLKAIQYSKPGYTTSNIALKDTWLSIGKFDTESFTNEQNAILKRFAKAFGLAYTRFLDLQKAEVQSREAQIELSLERVRAKTMAMHNSADVGEPAAVMVEELTKLGIETIRCGIGIMHETGDMEVWTLSTDENNKTNIIIGWLDMNLHPLLHGAFQSWHNKADAYAYELKGTDLINYYNAINNYPGYPIRYDIANLPTQIHHNEFHFTEGTLFAFFLQQLIEEQRKIFKRFAGVFGQTYRRYLDLKKAEAQAKEAQIEAALEKVRGKAMAMHNSNDLSATASMVFTELRKLGINPIRCGVGLLHKESRKAQLYSASSSADGDNLSLVVGWVILSQHPVLEKIYHSWLNNEEYYPQLQGEQMRSYYQLLLKGLPVAVPAIEGDEKQYGHFLPVSVGCLYAWAENAYTETEIKILKRFATITDLTFRRYIELQKSEANAREAVKQAALDRIRADIAAMRTISDLDRITPLIWNELTILGIPFIRCGVFLMDDAQQLIHTFLSTPDGNAIAAFHLPYNTPGNFGQVVIHWRNNKNYNGHWGKNEFEAVADILVKQNAIASCAQYLDSLPEEGFYLHFLPFLQGMLYAGNTTPLDEEEIETLQSVADAFATAYARYEDFNKLEAAKKQVDSTLNELQATQKQLIQAEKMASLGELTAGIAHEIQNPLNFVNNFSEVSNEMIAELQAERSKQQAERDEALEDEIINDIKQNLEKINHHGKRADAIVKGMLQHSRASSGKRELTDINALVDECVRLSYHGMRAKNKEFNAEIEMNLGESLSADEAGIGKVNIVPQDISRVLLNLLNNAFYAVNEKSQQSTVNSQQPLSNEYKPLVSVKTKKTNDKKVEIVVSDNGIGIPQNIINRIFQPFFTTKPTGQGTGLGLSLSYDIIKAHGGEIKVETKEGEGTEFKIYLPV